jgi:hypothetical protein
MFISHRPSSAALVLCSHPFLLLGRDEPRAFRGGGFKYHVQRTSLSITCFISYFRRSRTRFMLALGDRATRRVLPMVQEEGGREDEEVTSDATRKKDAGAVS